ncbi:MAG: response regulator transcription factor [Gemmatimonadetes bacterium]|nr:response regulator transcription factor [Gemmatimonadota bacterium]
MSAGSARPIRVALVEDREDVRQGLDYLIDGSDGFRSVGAFGAAEPALEAFERLEVDVVLMDIGLPGISGIEASRMIRDRWPSIQIMMLTVYEDDQRIFESLEAGATGYVLKKTPPAELLESIASLHAGGSPMSGAIARRVVETFHTPGPREDETASLTPREREILELLAQGHRYREIAAELSISYDTVRTHIRHIYEKMQVRSRTEATVKYLTGSSRPDSS